MDNHLSSPIQYIKGVGPQRASLLGRLGIHTILDALLYLPFRYEDRSAIKKIADISFEELTTISGKVVRSDLVSPSPRRPRLKMVEAIIADGSGTIKAKWFNQPYLKRVLKPGSSVVLHGAVKYGFGSGKVFLRDAACFEMVNPEYELLDDNEADTDQIHTGRIVPIYRSTEGLSQKQLRTILYTILHSAASTLPDHVPATIIKAYNFPALRESIHNVHFPTDPSSLEELNRGISPYHQRLAFNELFTLQLGLAAIKKGEATEKGISFAPDGRFTRQLLQRLPFTLTAAQERVFDEIHTDMQRPRAMNRLIQGDVGSGKTIVALLSMLAAVECGYQAALMAPTEILAEQHFITIHRLIEDLGLRIHLLTGSQRNKNVEIIASGNADIVVGTHALIQEGVSFNRLGLAVVDEQHRFGVMQRALLRKKGQNPDILVMTATPIPRTLALTLYGDLDYSIIDELPPNRSPIITKLVSESQREQVHATMKDEISKGRQVYVVYPIIEESEKIDLKDAVTGKERLQRRFHEFNTSLIHGKMKPLQREEIMAEFKKGGIHILVSTTVIEVGVDVPNATVMVIIHAERFGLSQLHQLRGRVGRGGSQSYCMLLSYHPSEDARKRLHVMVETTDGFRIAEEDLLIRGPGEFFGTRQSGLPDLKVADVQRDARLLEAARKEAFALIEDDPRLEKYPALRESIEDFWGRKLELFKTA